LDAPEVRAPAAVRPDHVKELRQLEAEAAGLVSKHQRYSGNPGTLRTVVDLGESDGARLVDVQATQEARDILDSTGRVVSSDTLKSVH